MKRIGLRVVTPEKIFFEGEVNSISLRGWEGYLGVYYDHTPLVTPLLPGILRINVKENESRVAAISQGFLEVRPDKVTVIVYSAEWSEEIDGEVSSIK